MPPISPNPSTRNGAFRTTMVGKVDAGTMERVCREFRAGAKAGDVLVIDAKEVLGYAADAIPAARTCFAKLGAEFDVRTIVAIVPASLPRMGANTVAMALRAMGGGLDFRVFADDAQADAALLALRERQPTR